MVNKAVKKWYRMVKWHLQGVLFLVQDTCILLRILEGLIQKIIKRDFSSLLASMSIHLNVLCQSSNSDIDTKTS